MGNIKSLLSLLVEFIVAFLLGKAGYIAICYIIIAISGIEKYDYSPFGNMTGIPLGSSLGIFLTKKYILRTGKFSVLCLFTSLVFGFFAVLLLCLALYVIGLIGPSLSENVFFLLVPLFALIGYNAMEMLLRESPW